MLMWNNSYCTLQSFSGATSAKTTAIQDWTANKRLILPKILGRALGVAGSGDGLTTRDLGGIDGSETHKLTVDEMPSHTHTFTYGRHQYDGSKRDTGTVMFWSGATKETNATGGNQSHSIVQPTAFVNVMIKL
jgi:microcystin-dependent protein